MTKKNVKKKTELFGGFVQSVGISLTKVDEVYNAGIVLFKPKNGVYKENPDPEDNELMGVISTDVYGETPEGAALDLVVSLQGIYDDITAYVSILDLEGNLIGELDLNDIGEQMLEDQDAEDAPKVTINGNKMSIPFGTNGSTDVSEDDMKKFLASVNNSNTKH